MHETNPKIVMEDLKLQNGAKRISVIFEKGARNYQKQENPREVVS